MLASTLPTQWYSIRVYMVQVPCRPLLKGSADLCMCGGQIDPNITQNLMFLDDLLIFYQAFDTNLPFSWCDIFVGDCMSITCKRS